MLRPLRSSCACKFAVAVVYTATRADSVNAAAAMRSSFMTLGDTSSASSRRPISPLSTFSFVDHSLNALLAAVSRVFASFAAMRDSRSLSCDSAGFRCVRAS